MKKKKKEEKEKEEEVTVRSSEAGTCSFIPSVTSNILTPRILCHIIVRVLIVSQVLLTTVVNGQVYEPMVPQSQMKSQEMGRNITLILNNFFDHGYDKRVRPKYGKTPVQVGVSMYIVDISSVSEVSMDFTSDFYFRQKWIDSRLSFQSGHGIESLSVGSEVGDKIWVPDTFFANEKSAYFHIATTPNTFIRIYPNGEVLLSMR